MNLSSAYLGTAAAHVDFNATVTSPPRFFYSARSRLHHEAFAAQSACGPLEVVDNVDIAPPAPVQPGDRVEISGVMVHDPGKAPIVHWTHHDPSGTHRGGFIRVNGRTYA